MPVIQLFYRAFLTEFFSDPRISTARFRKYAINVCSFAHLLLCSRCLQCGTG
jgi:hypothetical protein